MSWNYGKYRRCEVSSIPTSYLLWFLNSDGKEWASPKRKHRVMAMQELERRKVTYAVANRATELAARKLASQSIRGGQ